MVIMIAIEDAFLYQSECLPIVIIDKPCFYAHVD